MSSLQVSDEVADAVINLSKADVHTAYAQLVAETQCLLDQLEVQPGNQRLYGQLRQKGATAVSLLRLLFVLHSICKACFVTLVQSTFYKCRHKMWILC